MRFRSPIRRCRFILLGSCICVCGCDFNTPTQPPAAHSSSASQIDSFDRLYFTEMGEGVGVAVIAIEGDELNAWIHREMFNGFSWNGPMPFQFPSTQSRGWDHYQCVLDDEARDARVKHLNSIRFLSLQTAEPNCWDGTTLAFRVIGDSFEHQYTQYCFPDDVGRSLQRIIIGAALVSIEAAGAVPQSVEDFRAVGSQSQIAFEHSPKFHFGILRRSEPGDSW